MVLAGCLGERKGAHCWVWFIRAAVGSGGHGTREGLSRTNQCMLCMRQPKGALAVRRVSCHPC